MCCIFFLKCLSASSLVVKYFQLVVPCGHIFIWGCDSCLFQLNKAFFVGLWQCSHADQSVSLYFKTVAILQRLFELLLLLALEQIYNMHHHLFVYYYSIYEC